MSKSLGHLFLVELARCVRPSVAVINAVSPSLCYGSALHREASSAMARADIAEIKGTIGRSRLWVRTLSVMPRPTMVRRCTGSISVAASSSRRSFP